MRPLEDIRQLMKLIEEYKRLEDDRQQNKGTLHNYTSRYWELYNEINKGNEKIAASTFRLGLLEDSELRDLLTRRPFEDMR